jgi:excisionase family DNA binding protein
MSDFLTTTQAAELLGLSRQRVGVLVKGGRFPGAEQSSRGKWSIPAASVAGFVHLPRSGNRTRGKKRRGSPPKRR